MRSRKAAAAARSGAPCARLLPGIYATAWGVLIIDPREMDEAAWSLAEKLFEPSIFRAFIAGPYERGCIKRGVDPFTFANALAAAY